MSKDLKILFFTVTHSNGGGGERVLTVLANNLPKTWKVDVLELMAFKRKKESFNKDINILPYLEQHGQRTKFGSFVIHVLSHHPQIIKALRGLYDYDVVVGWMAVEGIYILPAFSECKTIAWFHNNIDHLHNLHYTQDANAAHIMTCHKKKRIFEILKKGCSNADKLVGVSKMCKTSIENVFPEYQNKTCIIYNGTDIEELHKMSREKIGDAKLSALYDRLTQSSHVLICIGHICERKNFILAVRSLAILKQKEIECNLVIIGSPATEKELKTLLKTIDECKVQNNVFLFGYQQNPITFLSRAKLLLMTSLDEGFPTVVTEGMALGIPFVTTPVEGASDELSNGGKCGLVSDWDAQSYASCIEKLLKDDRLYKNMSENCKEHVKNYSIENYVGSLKNLINEIPKKDKCKKKRMNIVVATLLFVFYSAFFATYDNTKACCAIKARLYYLKTHFSVLNFVKLIFRSAIFSINILCFPPMLFYCSFLVVKYRKRLFAR